MRAWFFTEDAYPHLPAADTFESIRVNLPNKHFDPETGADLYHMYLDLWCAADEMGLEIMNNERHQTATCMVPAAPIMLGILARETKRARLLILGNPVANRSQPVRVAEEMALVDVISRGRLECGFVRGVPYEIAPANMFPYRGNEKLWEAHDLIMKAWTHHEGSFNFEGRWFHSRQVNIWLRPYQQPHPPPVAATIMKGAQSGVGFPVVPQVEDQMARGNFFAGTPDQVFQQIKNFWEYSGGFGNLLMMGQAGFMTFDETLKSMKLFTQEVCPRLKELTSSYDSEAMRELRSARPDVENVDVGAFASEFVR